MANKKKSSKNVANAKKVVANKNDDSNKKKIVYIIIAVIAIIILLLCLTCCSRNVNPKKLQGKAIKEEDKKDKSKNTKEKEKTDVAYNTRSFSRFENKTPESNKIETLALKNTNNKNENQDTTSPVARVFYSTTDLTNEDIVITIVASEKLQEVEGWTLSEDKCSITKTVSANESGAVVLVDLAGNKTTVEYDVANIDKEAPTADVTYSTTDPTNQDVIITITASEDVTMTDDAWTQNDNEFTKTVTANETGALSITDLAGNTTDVEYNVTNIDKEAPTADVIYSTTDPTNQDVIITITASEDVTITDDVWTQNGNEFTKTVTANENGTLSITDLAGNTTDVEYNVTNIDKEAPEVLEELSSDDKYSKVYKFNITDATEVQEVRIAKGDYTIADFEASTVQVGERLDQNNDYEYTIYYDDIYTVYTIDTLGNSGVYKFNVSNISDVTLTDSDMQNALVIGSKQTRTTGIIRTTTIYSKSVTVNPNNDFEIVSMKYVTWRASESLTPSQFANSSIRFGFVSRNVTTVNPEQGYTAEDNDISAYDDYHFVYIKARRTVGPKTAEREYVIEVKPSK